MVVFSFMGHLLNTFVIVEIDTKIPGPDLKLHNHIEVDISVVLTPSVWHELLLREERNSF